MDSTIDDGQPGRKSEPTSFGSPKGKPDLPEADWHYAIDGVETGPVRRAEVMAAAEKASPSASFLVWRSGSSEWIDIGHSGLLAPAKPNAAIGVDEPSGMGRALFSFRGRLTRLPFLLWSSLLIFVYVIIVGAVLLAAHLDVTARVAVLIRFGLFVPFLWSVLALTTKRLHDLNRSGTHLLWIMPAVWIGSLPIGSVLQTFLLILNGLVCLWLVCKRGTADMNAFGTDPLGRASSPTAPVASRPQKKSSRPALWLVGGLAGTVTVGFLAFAVLDGEVPSCSDQGVEEKVRQIVAENSVADRTVFLAGGIDNVTFSIRGVRTLSNNQPLNGRTCAATVAVSMKPGAFGRGEAGSRDVTFTVQKVDDHPGQYIVAVLR